MARNVHAPQSVSDLPLFAAKPKPTVITKRDRVLAAVAERAGDDFAVRADRCVLEQLRILGPTPGETLTDLCRLDGITPDDDRAFGSVFMRLLRRGLIERVGFVPRTKGNGSAGGSVYRLVPR